MTKLEQLEKSVRELDKGDLEKFAAWFDQLQSERWDAQFSADVERGALDGMAKDAIADFKSGRSRSL